jgi:DNA-binding PadR family transcriptional regulator
MPKSNPNPLDILPLTPAVLHILLALSDGEKHGYAIMQEVEAMTNGDLTMGPGTLYGTIKRMLKANLIEESDERPDPDMDDKRRRYYRMTGFGQQVITAEARRLSRLVNIAQSKQVFGGVS